MNIHWNAFHVKGHQLGKDLPCEVQLNNRADELTIEAHNTTATNAPPLALYTTAGIHINIGDAHVTQAID
eukprot:7216335-Ditylum_brightwellii.AAC.1